MKMASENRFFLNNSSFKTGEMFILPTLIKNSKIYFLAKFQPDYVIFVYFIDQKVLVCKIHSAIRNNFKLSQLGDFTMPSQS